MIAPYSRVARCATCCKVCDGIDVLDEGVQCVEEGGLHDDCDSISVGLLHKNEKIGMMMKTRWIHCTRNWSVT